VLSTDSSQLISFIGLDLPVINVILLILCQIILLFVIVGTSRLNTVRCDFCSEWHALPFDKNAHQINYYYSPSFVNYMTNSTDQVTYACLACGFRYLGERCPNCDVTKTFVCSNCHYPYPVYENTCWKCNKSVATVYDRIMDFKSDDMNELSIGFSLFFASVYIVVLLQLIISLPNLLGSTESDFVLVSYMLYLIIGITMFGIYNWSRSNNNPIFGKLLARYIVAIAVIQLGLYFLGIGFNIVVAFSSIFVIFLSIVIFLIFMIAGIRIFNAGVVVIN
jgi:hypothetical protein